MVPVPSSMIAQIVTAALLILALLSILTDVRRLARTREHARHIAAEERGRGGGRA